MCTRFHRALLTHRKAIKGEQNCLRYRREIKSRHTTASSARLNNGNSAPMDDDWWVIGVGNIKFALKKSHHQDKATTNNPIHPRLRFFNQQVIELCAAPDVMHVILVRYYFIIIPSRPSYCTFLCFAFRAHMKRALKSLLSLCRWFSFVITW